ncbi:unnamed protein product [Cladocopium goreaui]|uniref:Uncharacterized protein n=1 Tax=Cladocopium goreaui TaxID=2562237 RepID=A0A9P1CST4_9DINO|nr:unnamed protein product [Cladocopium goreaui]
MWLIRQPLLLKKRLLLGNHRLHLLQFHCRSETKGAAVDRELHNYWDQHSGSGFDEKSRMNGRLEPLRRVAEVAKDLAEGKLRNHPVRVVDLGCGTGLFSKFLSDAENIKIIGVDLSEGHLQLARQHMEVIKGSYLDWRPEGWAPDLAIHNNSIEDYEDSMKLYFFKHVFSWLAPEGYFLFQAYSPRDKPMGVCIAECSPAFAAKHKVHLCSTETYLDMAKAAGFQVVSSELVHSQGRFPGKDRTYNREFIFIVLKKEVARLAILLADNIYVSRLSLNECNLGDQGAEYLAEALAENEVLTSLSLEGNRVGDRGAARLAAALERNEALTSLSLGRNCVGGQGVKHLLDALESNYTLLTLDLASNSGNRPGWASAGDSRAATQKRLQALLKRNRGPRKVVTLQAQLGHREATEATEADGDGDDPCRSGSFREPPEAAMLWISCTSVAGTLLTELLVDANLGVRQLREELAQRLAVPKPHLAMLLTDGRLLQVHDQRPLVRIFMGDM